MIPNIQPPPLWLPQGWTPNALRPTPAQIATDVIAEQTTIVNAITEANAITLAQSAGIYVVRRTITDVEMRAILGSPITVVAAAGAGFTWLCVQYGWYCTITTNGGVGVTLTSRFRGGVPDPRTCFPAATAISNIAAPSVRCFQGGGSTTFNTQVAGDSVENVSIDVIGSANAGAAHATANGFHVWMIVHKVAIT